MTDTEPASPRQQIVDALEDYPVACWTPGNLADRALRAIGTQLKAGQDAEKRLQAVTEAVILWRDRPGGDIDTFEAGADWAANLLDLMARGVDPK